MLLQHGYAARTIPKQYGGFGAAPDPLKTRIIAEEFADAGVPPALAGIGISMLVPTLLEKGTEEQKQKWIAPTLRGEVDLVPGLFRAERRLRSRVADDARRGRRRRLRHQRAEDLDVAARATPT